MPHYLPLALILVMYANSRIQHLFVISIEWEYFLFVSTIMADFQPIRYIMFSISFTSMSPASLPIILHHFLLLRTKWFLVTWEEAL
mmetsp:Transcript_10737/g.21351  ORF Transcript_10737/g.21351 Transcript_10737/m.21351 type:complete len:86 (-) Transcript_10737:1105-1362(-)